MKDSLTVGFAGNPNCGKTTLFNAFTGAKLKTANWPGVTVERMEGRFDWKGQEIKLIDLPGIYSLDSYTIEERTAKQFLDRGHADVIVNVMDASLLERSLYLSLQLLKQNRPVVLALNMMDEVQNKGMKIDMKKLSGMLGGIPVVPISARNRQGLDVLIETAIEAAAVRIPAGCGARFGSRKHVYPPIERIAEECLLFRNDQTSFTDKLDRYLVHPVLGIPIFLTIMAVLFWLTFTVGNGVRDWFQTGLNQFTELTRTVLQDFHTADWTVSLITDGIITGVGGVLSFLPNLAVLFLAMAVLEDSGYMARAAYVMNEIMGAAGLSGKAFLPLLLGFGCSVPAVMAARTLSSEEDKKKTIFMIPFMSCSAKLPIYILFGEVFFPENRLAAAYCLYLTGLGAAVLLSMILHRGEKTAETDLLIELPEYRIPTLRSVAVYGWEKIRDYLSKAGTTIFLASMILWILLNMGPDGLTAEVSHSFAAEIGTFLEPVLAPCGLGYWQIAVALLSGLSAKEVVISSLAVLFHISNINSPAGKTQLSMALGEIGFGIQNVYAMLVFCLFYTPCIAALAAIRRETGSVKWTLRLAAFQMAAAWTAAVFIYQIGKVLL